MAVTDQTAQETRATKAQLKYAFMSATKARAVLDLIRNKPVGRAQEILQFSNRFAAKDVGKVLRSAIANAQQNDSLEPEELYVSGAYADEARTLRRFRPRARGRATRIRKRTCHITVMVSRMSDEQLERMRAKQDAAGASRRKRVEKSRQKTESKKQVKESAIEEALAAEEEAQEVPAAAAVEVENGVAEQTEAEQPETKDEVVEPSTEEETNEQPPAEEEANETETKSEGEDK